jgi:hypothetical protein
MIEQHPYDAARERQHARREKKLRALYGLPKAQQQKQRENLVPLPKAWTDKDGAQLVEAWKSRWAIIYQHAPRHLPVNHQPAEQRWHVFAVDRSSTPGREVLGLLVSVQESLDGAIDQAARIDNGTS